MKLLLFDIDGTIMKSGGDGTHPDSFSIAIKEIFDLEVNVYEVEPMGKIDSQILLELLELKGVERSIAQEKLSELFDQMVKHVKKKLKNAHLLPNVRECLEELAKRDDVIIGLLTGNLEEIAWAKMEVGGIREYFLTGGFGNEALKRSDLVPIAIKKNAKHNIAIDDVLLIGDTPRDISCAKEAGCKVIAIPTGDYSKEELAKNSPDFLIESLLEIPKLV